MRDGATESGPVTGVLERVEDAARSEEVTVRDIVRALGHASFAPLLLAPALLIVSPLSGVPTFSSIAGITIALIAGQMAARRDHLWLPGWLLRRAAPGRRVNAAVGWLRRPARWLEGLTRRRFRLFTSTPALFLAQILCTVCGLAMPLLEFTPFASSLLGAMVSVFAVGFLARDGAFILAGFAAFAALVGGGYVVIA